MTKLFGWVHSVWEEISFFIFEFWCLDDCLSVWVCVCVCAWEYAPVCVCVSVLVCWPALAALASPDFRTVSPFGTVSHVKSTESQHNGTFSTSGWHFARAPSITDWLLVWMSSSSCEPSERKIYLVFSMIQFRQYFSSIQFQLIIHLLIN